MIIPVNQNGQEYDIILERGALGKAGEYLNLERKVLIVTDTGVPENYARTVASYCAEAHIVTIPRGESSKSFSELQRILSEMLRYGFTRSDCAVAVGGGVPGDLTGFAASCYMRGIDFYNIPSTLLSQVDSSIGGKTAIDFENVKNSIGAFYPPKKVIIDPDLLKTLDVRQLHAGLAEAIKMSANFDAGLFGIIESSSDIDAVIADIIERSLRIKKYVVENDPVEKGLRRVLNFGHTIGHAIESISVGKLLHGECVGLGMIPMCGISVRGRIKAVLEKYDLPTEIKPSADELMPYILHDKKLKDGNITAVYTDKIGEFKFVSLTPEQIREYVETAK